MQLDKFEIELISLSRYVRETNNWCGTTVENSLDTLYEYLENPSFDYCDVYRGPDGELVLYALRTDDKTTVTLANVNLNSLSVSWLVP